MREKNRTCVRRWEESTLISPRCDAPPIFTPLVGRQQTHTTVVRSKYRACSGVRVNVQAHVIFPNRLVPVFITPVLCFMVLSCQEIISTMFCMFFSRASRFGVAQKADVVIRFCFFGAAYRAVQAMHLVCTTRRNTEER